MPLIEFRRRSQAVRPKSPLPVSAGLRVAQLTSVGPLFGEARPFDSNLFSDLQSFAPQVLVGSLHQLESLARRVRDGGYLTSLDRAIFVVTDCRDVPLLEPARARLWQAFGVPLYEILLGADRLPIASECDAHDGWHVSEGVTFASHDGALWFRRKREALRATGLTGDLDASPCPCAQRGTRILNPRMDYRDPLRHGFAQPA